MELSKEFLNGFCQALIGKARHNGYGKSVTLKVIEEYRVIFVVFCGCRGVEPHSPGDHNNPPKRGELIIEEMEKINLSMLWIDCKENYQTLYFKLHGYFADVTEESDENEEEQ